MPNNPNRTRARVSLPPAGNKLARAVFVTGSFRLQNVFFANPELQNPAGGPTALPPASTAGSGGGGGGGSGGVQLN